MQGNKKSKVDNLNYLHLQFDKHVELLRICREILRHEKIENYDVIAPLLYSIIDSCESVSLLSQKGKIRDCYILSRTIYETGVNLCFICAKGKDAAEKAKRHALQKSFRDLHRELEIGGMKLSVEWQGQIDLSANPSIDAALKEFTNKQGREITSWTPENIKDEIKAIDDRFGKNASVNLQFGLISIYRHASEIAHGTLFGALFSIGLTSPNDKPNTPQELINFQCDNLYMLILMLIATINTVLIVLSNQLPIQELVDTSASIIKEIKSEDVLSQQ